MSFRDLTLIAADNAGNDLDYDAWDKTRELIRAANAGQLQGFKNLLVNGDFAIDLRTGGAGATLGTSPAYFVDRWSAQLTAVLTGAVTAARVATAGATPARYMARLQRSSGSYAGAIQMRQMVNSAIAIPLAGRSVTLSFKARKGSAYGSTLAAYIISGTAVDEAANGITAGTWTGFAVAAQLLPTLSTSFQEFSLTGTLGSSVQEIGVRFDTGNFTGSGGANDYVDITDIQLEAVDPNSPRVSPFERLPEPIALTLCRHFFQKKTVRSENGSRHIPLAPMRAAPTITVGVGSAANITNEGFELSHSSAADCLVSADAEL